MNIPDKPQVAMLSSFTMEVKQISLSYLLPRSLHATVDDYGITFEVEIEGDHSIGVQLMIATISFYDSVK